MKSLKLLSVVFFMASIIFTYNANAQSMQKKDLTMTIEEWYIPCLDIFVTGTWTAHFTYHLNKDGKIDRMHFNTFISDFVDMETGEKIKVIDTGNDKLGTMFWFLNNPTSANGDPDKIYYNVPEDGWLNEYMPEIYPFDEGSYVEMNFKWMYKGIVYGGKFRTQLHINANGEITADQSVGEMYCRD